MRKQSKLMAVALLFVLCFTLVPAALAVDRTVIEEEVNASDPINCRLVSTSVREFCDSNNNWNVVTTYYYTCQDNSTVTRTTHEVFAGCPW